MVLYSLPPSGLPAISPSRGEIGSFDEADHSAMPVIGEIVRESAISPLEGEMAGRPEGGTSFPMGRATR
ncbi:hypothetical protein MesoLjLc_36750 [Mesorhizobium sp. L-8-10]|nr:hypothetical protein MesoLjLb_37900 [Mesorhizobium sp. L-8-3]BCH31745.1 hypothetical protein MesoLjLc_36750 [Mesorhizobium sp. L-8-10]